MPLFEIHNPHTLSILEHDMDPHKTLEDPAGCRTIRRLPRLIEDGLPLLV